MGNRGASATTPLVLTPSGSCQSPASRQGQDKRFFCRSAAIYYGIIMGIYGTSIKRNVCPDPVWKPMRYHLTQLPPRRFLMCSRLPLEVSVGPSCMPTRRLVAYSNRIQHAREAHTRSCVNNTVRETAIQSKHAAMLVKHDAVQLFAARK